MSAGLTIPDHERRRLHVLAVNLPEAEVRARHHGGTEPAPDFLADVTGLPDLDPSGAELIALGDLAGLRLSGYLTEGHEIDAKDVAAQRARLDRIEGYALILRSEAFGGRGREMRTPRLTPIASFDAPGPDWAPAGRIDSASARPYSGPGTAAAPVPDPAKARRGSALVVLALVALAVLLWSVLG